jgi:hypothetical protein
VFRQDETQRSNKKQSIDHEKVLFRVTRGHSSVLAALSISSGASLGSLLLRTLASPLLASWLLVCRLLAPGILGLLPLWAWQRHRCCTRLKSLIYRYESIQAPPPNAAQHSRMFRAAACDPFGKAAESPQELNPGFARSKTLCSSAQCA